MPKNEEAKKKPVKIEVDSEMIKKEFHKLGHEVKRMIDTAKDKYEKADPKTKKAVIAGVAGAAALIAGAIGYKKMKKK